MGRAGELGTGNGTCTGKNGSTLGVGSSAERDEGAKEGAADVASAGDVSAAPSAGEVNAGKAKVDALGAVAGELMGKLGVELCKGDVRVVAGDCNTAAGTSKSI
jgi:hypothetical protein